MVKNLTHVLFMKLRKMKIANLLQTTLFLVGLIIFMTGPIPSAHAQLSSANILVTDKEAGTGSAQGVLFRVDPANGDRILLSDFGNSAQGPLGSDDYGLSGVAVEDLGTILVTEVQAGTDNRGALFRINPVNGNRTIVSDFGNSAQGQIGAYPIAVAIEDSGTILVTDYEAGTDNRGAVFRVNPANGNRIVVSDFGDSVQGQIGVSPFGVAVDASGDILIVDRGPILGGTRDGYLFRVDPVSGYRTVVSDFSDVSQGTVGLNGDDPAWVAIDTSGDILVIDQFWMPMEFRMFGYLLRIDPSTGYRTLVSNFLDSAQGPTGTPEWIAIDSSGDFLVAFNSRDFSNVSALLRVDPANGNRTVVSDFSDGSQGPPAQNLVGVALAPVLNQPPTANAGPDQHVSYADVVILDGSDSTDAEDSLEDLTFQWTQIDGTGVELSNADTKTASFTASAMVQSLTFELAVTDTYGNVSTATVIVTVFEDVDNAIFVNPRLGEGDDTNPGTMDEPVRTLQRALELAESRTPNADIYLQAGGYRTTTTLTIKDDMSLYGGFAAGWTRTATFPTRILGQATALEVLDITVSTTIDGLNISAADGQDGHFTGDPASGAGENSIAIYVRNAEEPGVLSITNNEIFAGKGGNGDRGLEGIGTGGILGSFDGGDGNPGWPGLDWFMVKSYIEETGMWGSPGGAGGLGSFWGGLPGGRGGHSLLNEDGEAGRPGVGSRGGSGGPGGTKPILIICTNCEGKPGGDGGNGSHGAGGSGGDGFGVAVDHTWRGSQGELGGFGEHGKGGGGGGAGAGGPDQGYWRTPVSGGGGGGGGAGGAGAIPGGGGFGGGGSIGILLSHASPFIGDNIIMTDGGGAGGAGGNGAEGGDGGLGGAIGNRMFARTGSGGAGGEGGKGGSSGGGGGGGGGISCDILETEMSHTMLGWNTPTLGDGGPGGVKGIGGPGADDGEFGESGLVCMEEEDLSPPPEIVIPGGTETTVVELSDVFGRLTITSAWRGSDVEMTLITPGGEYIEPDTNDPDVIHVKGEIFEAYSITNPEVGTWTIELFGADVPEAGEEVTITVTTLPENHPPVADAGPDVSIEALSLEPTNVALNGSASSDPDGDPLSFKWTDKDNNLVGSTPQLSIMLPLGQHTFNLMVSDGRGGTDDDTISVTVQDTIPPTIESLTASPSLLWPPNHKMVSVAVEAHPSDSRDPEPTCTITSVSSNEPIDGPGDGAAAPDWQITGDLTLDLRSERSGEGTGRLYEINVTCTDASSNYSDEVVHVFVPYEILEEDSEES